MKRENQRRVYSMFNRGITGLGSLAALLAFTSLWATPLETAAQTNDWGRPVWQQAPATASAPRVGYGTLPSGQRMANQQAWRASARPVSPYPVRQASAEAVAMPAVAPQPAAQPPATPTPPSVGSGGKVAPAPMPAATGEIVYEGGAGPILGEAGPGFGDGYGCEVGAPCGDVCDIGPFCGPGQGFLWTRIEYLLWWSKASDTPPLVTTSPDGSLAGLTLRPGSGAQILFGGRASDEPSRSGLRANLGLWLDSCQTYGLEATYIGLGQESQHFAASNLTNTTVGRPFFDVSPTEYRNDPAFDGYTAGLVAFPGTITGTVTIDSYSEFQAVEVLMRRAWLQDCAMRLDMLAGYRFAHLVDDLSIVEATQSIVTPVTTQLITDHFRTLNEFHGAVIGGNAQWRYCRWTMDALLKLAVGSTTTTTTIGGTTVTNSNPAQTGGILAQPSNSGRFTQSELAMMPELGLTLGYDMTCRMRLTFGYSLLYWSKVGRAGDQIDLDINSSQFPGANTPGTLVGLPRPEFDLRTTDYWTQGLSFGLDYRF